MLWIAEYNPHRQGKAAMRTDTFNWLAGYGAVLSTITFIVQIFRDRARLKIEVQQGREIVGDILRNPRIALYAGMTMTVIYVTNRGRRPVTIKKVGGQRLFPDKGFVCMDVIPQIPCELTEGKQLTVLADEKDLKPTRMESYWVATSAGKTIRLNIAPWYRRWLSRWQRWWHRKANRVPVVAED